LEETILSISAKLDERMANRQFDYVATVLFYDFSDFIEELSIDTQKELARILEKGPKLGYMPIVITDVSLTKHYDTATKVVRNFKQGLIATRINDQQVLNVNNRPNTREPVLEVQEHYLVQDNMARKVKVFIE